MRSEPYASWNRRRAARTHAADDPTTATRRAPRANLTIGVAAQQEQIEPDPTIEIDPTEISERRGALTRQFREHQARETDLVDDSPDDNRRSSRAHSRQIGARTRPPG